jgi:hypothetical protein
MWIMNFLPTWVFHAILVLGILGLVASVVLKFIPFVSTYTIPLQVGALLLTIVGVWYQGAISNQAAWEAKVAALEIRVKAAEAEAARENVKIVEKIVIQTKKVKEKGDDIITYVDREVIKYDNTCPIPVVVIKALNAAALNQAVEEGKK